MPEHERPVLRGEHIFDVAVVGGGIAGLTTALLLKRQGLAVAVVEADPSSDRKHSGNRCRAGYPSTMTTPIPVEERRARDMLLALRLMGQNGEGFDALLLALREEPHLSTVE